MFFTFWDFLAIFKVTNNFNSSQSVNLHLGTQTSGTMELHHDDHGRSVWIITIQLLQNICTGTIKLERNTRTIELKGTGNDPSGCQS